MISVTNPPFLFNSSRYTRSRSRSPGVPFLSFSEYRRFLSLNYSVFLFLSSSLSRDSPFSLSNSFQYYPSNKFDIFLCFMFNKITSSTRKNKKSPTTVLFKLPSPGQSHYLKLVTSRKCILTEYEGGLCARLSQKICGVRNPTVIFLNVTQIHSKKELKI